MKESSKIRKIAFVGDHLPRKCGIATLASDLLAAVAAAHPQSQCFSVSVNDIKGWLRIPTITTKVLSVFIVLEHRRREVLHFGVTEYPSAAWTSQQIVEAFADRHAPRYLLRDRDSIYGSEVQSRIASLHIEEALTGGPQSLAESVR